MTEKLSAEDARQGGSGKRVLTILIVAIVLCLLAYGMIEFFQGVPETEVETNVETEVQP